MPVSYGPIQSLPRGLLGFFNLKNAGKYPDTIGSELAPGFELLDWYMQANSENQPLASTAALAAGAVGFQTFTTNPLVIPDNEFWYVTHYQVSQAGLAAATDTVAYVCGFRNPAGGAPVLISLGGERQQPITGAAVSRQARAFWNGFFVPPGSELGFSLQQIDSAGTLAFGGSCRRVRMQI